MGNHDFMKREQAFEEGVALKELGNDNDNKIEIVLDDSSKAWLHQKMDDLDSLPDEIAEYQKQHDQLNKKIEQYNNSKHYNTKEKRKEVIDAFFNWRNAETHEDRVTRYATYNSKKEALEQAKEKNIANRLQNEDNLNELHEIDKKLTNAKTKQATEQRQLKAATHYAEAEYVRCIKAIATLEACREACGITSRTDTYIWKTSPSRPQSQYIAECDRLLNSTQYKAQNKDIRNKIEINLCNKGTGTTPGTSQFVADVEKLRANLESDIDHVEIPTTTSGVKKIFMKDEINNKYTPKYMNVHNRGQKLKNFESQAERCY